VYEVSLISAFLDASQRFDNSSKVIFLSSVVPASLPRLLLELPQSPFRKRRVLRLEAPAKLLARPFDEEIVPSSVSPIQNRTHRFHTLRLQMSSRFHIQDIWVKKQDEKSRFSAFCSLCKSLQYSTLSP
jgi:hypothetical protein